MFSPSNKFHVQRDMQKLCFIIDSIRRLKLYKAAPIKSNKHVKVNAQFCYEKIFTTILTILLKTCVKVHNFVVYVMYTVFPDLEGHVLLTGGALSLQIEERVLTN